MKNWKVPKHTLNCLNGWLSPNGKLYPCESFGHTYLATQLIEHSYTDHGENTDLILEKLGWVKLHTEDLPNAESNWRMHILGSGLMTFDFSNLTNAQLDTILHWHEENKRQTIFLTLFEVKNRNLS